MENETQLRERIKLLNEKLNIKENITNNYFYFDTKIQNKRYQTKSRFKSDETKNDALKNIKIKKQKIIDGMTLYFN